MGAQIGDEVVIAEPGDLVLKPRGVPHAFWNAGDEPCRVLEFISPGGFENYFREIAPLLEGDEPDLEAAGGVMQRYGLSMDFDSIPGLIEEHGLLAAPPERVRERITTPAGINDEFRPFLRMTFPADVDQLTPETAPVGKRLFRSWILLLGVLPVDYDDITLVSIEPGRGFHERSAMGSQRVWEHERTIVAEGEGCRVTDRVSFEPRLPGTAGLTLVLARRVFVHRHRRLRRAFGSAPAA
jgi:hypothetical protein